MAHTIQTIITDKLHSSKVRYLLIGGSVYVLEIIIIVLATRAGISDVIAVAISFWVGLAVSFLLQKFVTFGDARTQRRVLSAQVAAVLVLVLWNFSFTIVLTKLLLPIAPTITRTLALLITTLWNYYLYKTRIFKIEGHA